MAETKWVKLLTYFYILCILLISTVYNIFWQNKELSLVLLCGSSFTPPQTFFRENKMYGIKKLKKKINTKIWKWYKKFILPDKTISGYVVSRSEAAYYNRAAKYARTKVGRQEYNSRNDTYYFGGIPYYWMYIWSYRDIKKLRFIGRYAAIFLQQRLEQESLKNFSTEDELLEALWENFFLTLMPWKYGLINPRIFSTIYLLDIIHSYRGWRHTRKMPSHGQRTWTNASTASRHNIWIKKMQSLRGKHLFGRIPSDIVNITMQAERVNLAWFINWKNEWRQERIAFLGADPKSRRKKNRRRVDLYSAAFLRLLTLTRISKMSKKQKKTVNRAYYTLGYKVGYSLHLLKKVHWRRKKKTGIIVMSHAKNVLLRPRQIRRKRKRVRVLKKVEKRRKVIKHLKKKREKQRKKRIGGRRTKRRRL